MRVDKVRMEKEDIQATLNIDPFPHVIIDNFYNEEELKLIWQELDFYTHPNKLVPAKDYGGIVGSTNALALQLSFIKFFRLQNYFPDKNIYLEIIS